jgi:proline iminopeptidase
MGCGRAGWYSWDRLDNAGDASAQHILPEWQHLAVGDQLPSVPDGRAWFEVASLIPGRELVLQASIDLRTGRSYDPRGQRPRFFVNSTWSFLLEERPDGATRLLVRTRGTGRPKLLQKLSDIVFWEPAHVIMQTRQFSGLRRRTQPEESGSPTPAAPVR